MKYTIRMGDTDETGGYYFTLLLHLANCAYEDFLAKHQLPINTPIRLAEGDFRKMGKRGDSIEVTLYLEKIGKTSFTLVADVAPLGKTRITYVHLGGPVPKAFRDALSQLDQAP